MTSGIGAAARDAAVRPQDDLFGHVNGRWLAETTIPDDRAVHGQFELLRDGAEIDLRVIVEEAAAGNAPAGSPARKVGDLYASFLDEQRADQLGVRPIAADLAAIAAVGGTGDLLRLMGRLQRQGVGGAVGLSVNTDKGDSSRYVVYLSQSGLGLPDESYYREEVFAGIRAAYVEHVAVMLALAGVADDADDAAVGTVAGRIMALETRLAAGHWDVVRNRDAVATYTLVDRAGWVHLSPGVDWCERLTCLATPDGSVDEVVVRQPGFLTAFAAALRDFDLADWKY